MSKYFFYISYLEFFLITTATKKITLLPSDDFFLRFLVDLGNFTSFLAK